jgi:hypothetical protein
MKRSTLGNNCGLIYQDKEDNLLLISASPLQFQSGDVLEVFVQDNWVRGNIEYKNSKGYLFYSEVIPEEYVVIKTGMKARVPHDVLPHFYERQLNK